MFANILPPPFENSRLRRQKGLHTETYLAYAVFFVFCFGVVVFIVFGFFLFLSFFWRCVDEALKSYSVN